MEKVNKQNRLQIAATIAEKLAATIQVKCLSIRKELFFDPILGFNHNMGGVRTRASIKNAEAYINNISGNYIQFKFRSHRMLWFTVKGVAKRYIISTPNQFDYSIESIATNPYLKIENELLKAASELRMMDQVYSELLIAA